MQIILIKSRSRHCAPHPSADSSNKLTYQRETARCFMSLS